MLPPRSYLRSVDGVSSEVLRAEADGPLRWEESIFWDVITVDGRGWARPVVPTQSNTKPLMKWKTRLTPFLELLCEHRYFSVFRTSL